MVVVQAMVMEEDVVVVEAMEDVAVQGAMVVDVGEDVVEEEDMVVGMTVVIMKMSGNGN